MYDNIATVVVVPVVGLIACGVWLSILSTRRSSAAVEIRCLGVVLTVRLGGVRHEGAGLESGDTTDD